MIKSIHTLVTTSAMFAELTNLKCFLRKLERSILQPSFLLRIRNKASPSRLLSFCKLARSGGVGFHFFLLVPKLVQQAKQIGPVDKM
jgi:hypothetical protein